MFDEAAHSYSSSVSSAIKFPENSGWVSPVCVSALPPNIWKAEVKNDITSIIRVYLHSIGCGLLSRSSSVHFQKRSLTMGNSLRIIDEPSRSDLTQRGAVLVPLNSS